MTRVGCMIAPEGSLGCSRPDLFDCTQHGTESSRIVFRCSHGEGPSSEVIPSLDAGSQQEASFSRNALR